MGTVKTAITINQPRAAVFEFWRNFANLPLFMHHLQSVRDLGQGLSRWQTKAPLGRAIEWDAQLTAERRGEFIGWRSLAGDVAHAGEVRFLSAPGARGTEVHVELTYELPGGKAGEAFAKLFGEDPARQISDDLRRLKQVLETGEVLRSTGSPEGAGVSIAQHEPARPSVEAGTGEQVEP